MKILFKIDHAMSNGNQGQYVVLDLDVCQYVDRATWNYAWDRSKKQNTPKSYVNGQWIPSRLPKREPDFATDMEIWGIPANHWVSPSKDICTQIADLLREANAKISEILASYPGSYHLRDRIRDKVTEQIKTLLRVR